MGRMWEEIIEKLNLNSIRFTFFAEESGNELFQIYDPDNLQLFAGCDFYVDCFTGNSDKPFPELSHVDYSYKELYDVLSSFFGEKPLDELIKAANAFEAEDDPDAYIRIWKSKSFRS